MTTKLTGAAEAVVKRKVQVILSFGSRPRLLGGCKCACTRAWPGQCLQAVISRHTLQGRGPNDCVRMDEQAKLEEYLPTATDSVLCDYVLVMVGNRKNSRQVSLDLEVERVFILFNFI